MAENGIAGSIQDEIAEDMENKFGWRVKSITPNVRGFANLSWIMNTDHGAVFVKKYDKVRYRRGLDGVRQALKYQDFMHRDGIPCQPVFSSKGEYIHTVGSGEEYMISGVSTGEHIGAGEANVQQMHSVGEATGRMHQWMSNNIPPAESLQWELPSKESMLRRLEKNLEETTAAENERYALAIEKQRSILNRLDLDELKASCQGWAHWDMHVDNLMFHNDRLADVLDFDRVHFVYPDFDISRALLSCSFSSNTMPIDSARAYAQGYRSHSSLTAGQLARSVKLTWYKEFKWVHAMYSTNKPMSRFIEEMIWIADNWDNLDEIFDGI